MAVLRASHQLRKLRLLFNFVHADAEVEPFQPVVFEHLTPFTLSAKAHTVVKLVGDFMLMLQMLSLTAFSTLIGLWLNDSEDQQHVIEALLPSENDYSSVSSRAPRPR